MELVAIEYKKKRFRLNSFTLGTPCFKEYSNKSLSKFWKKSYKNLLDGMEN